MNLEDKTVYLNTKDFLVSGESFALLMDEEKEMLITSPQPKSENLKQYYKSENYISHTDSNKGLMASLYQTVKKYSLSLKLKLITRENKGAGTVLDIGAGTGDFLKLAKDYKWETFGVEPNEGAREMASTKGINLCEHLDQFSDQQFDVITLWHVLEHLPDLEIQIKKIENLLKPNGTLIIAVPNFNSYDSKYYKQFWAAYDVPRHLWHFSRKSMAVLFSKQMYLKKTKPMLFDSFYVSLLSEKYKTGKCFSIKALFIGLWSNITAITSKEHSSIIYCYKKSE